MVDLLANSPVLAKLLLSLGMMYSSLFFVVKLRLSNSRGR
ncbi:protein of unknown function [Rhodovastum atsumiense]|nr:protein of unknown function [Rhodovastum atsumiense]